MPVILGQPWQRTYNGVPNWRREGINFEYDQARLFTPFLKDEDFATDTESEDEEVIPKPKEPPTTSIKEEDLEPTETPATSVEKEKSGRGESTTRTHPKKEEAKTKETTIKSKNMSQHHDIWIPKKTIQAQQGSTQIWVPKRAISESYSTKLRTQVSKR